MGLLARLVPGGAAEPDPRLLLPRRPVPSLDGQLHSDPHANRLVDARNLDLRHLAALHPRLPGDPLRDALRHGASPSLDDPDDLPRDRMDLPPVDGAPGSGLPLPSDRRLGLVQLRLRPRLVDHLHRLCLPAHLERDRDGGRRLLHRRVQGSGPRCQDRPQPRGWLRGVHLHDDPGRVRAGVGSQSLGESSPGRSEDDLRQVRRQSVLDRRQRPQLADRGDADRCARALGPERDHGLRSLHQMSVDGQFPRFFQHTNKHGVPDRAMLFNVAFSLALVFTGGAVEIYSLSNVGYTISFVPVLIGYFLLRKYRPNVNRPFRLPEWMKYVALALAALFFVIWIYGGLVYTSLPNSSLGGANTRVYYFIGWGILLSYLPLYWYRKKVEDPKYAEEAPPAAIPSPGS